MENDVFQKINNVFLLFFLTIAPFNILQYDVPFYLIRIFLLFIIIYNIVFFFLNNGRGFSISLPIIIILLISLIMSLISSNVFNISIFDMSYVSLILLVVYAFFLLSYKNFKFDHKFSTFVSIIVVFHSINIIYGGIYSTDLFGNISPLQNRSWGFFVHGAPPGGHFILALLWITIFNFRNPLNWLAFLTCFFAILYSGDRVPIFHSIITILIYIFFIHNNFFKRLLFLSILSLGFFFILQFNYFVRFNKIFDWLALTINSPAIIFSGTYKKSILENPDLFHHLEKYQIILDNFFNFTNFYFMFFGFGVGFSHHGIKFITEDIGRPHNLYIEIITTFGLFGSIILLLYLFRFLKDAGLYSIVALSIFLPFYNISLHSFNIFMLFLINLFFIKMLKNK